MPVLCAKNLSKIYGGKDRENSTYALNGISIAIEASEFVGVMGPSGSGKTTLLNILSGIDNPTSGSVEIAGKSINTLDKEDLALFRRQKLGYVFQDFNLLDSLTIRENVMLPMILDRRGTAEMTVTADEVMARFDIDAIAGKYPYNVSGGQQQKAAVARALVNNPAIVFADEPTGNLDSKSAGTVMRCFRKMNEEMNTTILLVTHDAYAASYCKRIVFIKDGEVSMEIVSKDDRREFYDRILDCLAVLGGEQNDL
jgi:putative ABC transport system ATP-binding protein